MIIMVMIYIEYKIVLKLDSSTNLIMGIKSG